MLLGQLLRPQENGNASNQTSTNGDNQGQDIEETQNKPEIEGDKHEGSAQEGAESAQDETTPASNS